MGARRVPLAAGAALSVVLALALAAGCVSVGAPPPPAPPDLPPPSVDRFPGGGARAPQPEAPPAAVATAASLPALTLPTETGDVRALWIVRTALLHPDSARAAVRRAHEAGFNTLLVQVRGRGDAYYDSRWEPWPDAMTGSAAEYDPLGTVLDEAGRLGLRVHAWINVHLVASADYPPGSPQHIVRARPELLAVPRALAVELFHRDPRDPAYLTALRDYTLANDAQVEGLYTNPVHPRVQDHLTFVVSDLLDRYAVDGIHLDYVRFPSPDFDYSRPSLEAFRVRVVDRVGVEGARGAELRWPQDPVAYVSAFPSLWDEFRTEQMTLTVERLYRAVKARRPGAVVSAAVFANADDARVARFQAWEDWLVRGIVDVVAPMAYTTDAGLFEAQIRRAARLDPRRVWAGVGIYQNSFQATVEMSRTARGMGVGGVALFSYDWAVGPDGTTTAGGEYLPRFAGEIWGYGR